MQIERYIRDIRATCFFALVVFPGPCGAAEPFPSVSDFAVVYTLTKSTPATPIDIGQGRDLAVSQYSVTATNKGGRGFLHLATGRCIGITIKVSWSIFRRLAGYCNFKYKDDDALFAEFTQKASSSTAPAEIGWTFTSGTGKYDGLHGSAKTSGNNDVRSQGTDQDVRGQGADQIAGLMAGSYKIVRSSAPSEYGVHD